MIFFECVPADMSIYVYKSSREVTANQAAALSTDNRWLPNGNEFSPLRRGKQLKKSCLNRPNAAIRPNSTYYTAAQHYESYTFVGDSAAPAGLEVISAPQPAHLRHLG